MPLLLVIVCQHKTGPMMAFLTYTEKRMIHKANGMVGARVIVPLSNGSHRHGSCRTQILLDALVIS